MKLWPPSRLRELYEEFSSLQVAPEEGAEIKFHTYHGFLVFVVQSEHRFCLPPDAARRLLWQFHKFNLTWGLLAYGLVFIPILSSLDYLVQKQAIAERERSLRKLRRAAAKAAQEKNET